MLAVAIMALVAVALYRFVGSSLQAIQYSTDDTIQKRAVQSLVSVLQSEFCNLPATEPNAFLGEAHKFSDKSADQMEWLTQAGNGLFTQTASGLWKVTLYLRPDDNNRTYTLGLLRQLPDNSNKEEHWLPLIPKVDAIEIRYFDTRLNTWLEKWSDSGTRPTLVRLRIWRKDQTIPYESVIQFPPTRLPS